ncbi:MAG: aminotransferase class I/II-fold pyridoxal phosphate-dependent enzyme [Chloroflexi bacterium]|nr:aminotransferase class I/II-fold pyridoxal phosphate-dependent enzyme [Chloroflexota bacterium]
MLHTKDKRSLTLSQRVEAIPPSGIRKYFDIAATLPDVISLSIGEPDFTTPAPIVQAGIRSLQAGETHYTSNSGILALRQALQEHLQRLYRVSYDPEREILVTVGASEAVNLAMVATLDPGDEVIVPEPSYVAYQPGVALAGGVPVPVPTQVEDNFQVTPDQIRRAITPRTKGLLLGYPNNPTGGVLSREMLLGIAEVAQEYDLLVYSDEIYDRLVYNNPHICVPSLPGMMERTILIGGFSKSYAMTGWRVGYVCGPAPLIAGLRKVHQYIIMSAPTTGQVAALAALQIGEPFVQAMVAEYDRRRRFLVTGLNRIGLPCFEPGGAFYVFPNIRSTGLTSDAFCERLLQEEHVAVIPGNAFGQSGEGYVRICYAAAYENIEDALQRIERFISRQGDGVTR